FEELIDVFATLRDKTVIIVTHQKKILDVADNIILLNKETQPIMDTREKMAEHLRDNEQVCGRLKRADA
ncbi:MAG: hypothetical protein K2M95_05505, partial [Clostridiales bacterium]|nr:hypothetical protein [Clostridiales bacterium]